MRIISSSKMPQPLREILKELKDDKGYNENEDFICWRQLNNKFFVHFIDRVELETGYWGLGKTIEYNCDTTVYIKKVNGMKPPKNSEYAIFSTPIPQLNIKEIDCFNEIVNNLNISNPTGKFVLFNHNQKTHQVFLVSRNSINFRIDIGQEKRNRSLVYVTNHCLSNLDSTVFEAHLQYHAMIIVGVHRALERENLVEKKSSR